MTSQNGFLSKETHSGTTSWKSSRILTKKVATTTVNPGVVEDFGCESTFLHFSFFFHHVSTFLVFFHFSCFSFLHFFHFCIFLKKVSSFLFSCISNKYVLLLASVSEFNCRCSMEMWRPDDLGRGSWDWVGPPAWGRACFNSPEWRRSSSPVKTEPLHIVLLLLLFGTLHDACACALHICKLLATRQLKTCRHGDVGLYTPLKSSAKTSPVMPRTMLTQSPPFRISTIITCNNPNAKSLPHTWPKLNAHRTLPNKVCPIFCLVGLFYHLLPPH